MLTWTAVSNSVLIPPLPSNSTLHPRSRANSLRSRTHPRSRSNSFNAPQTNHHSQPFVSPLSHSKSSDSALPTSGGITPPSTNGTDIATPVPTNILSPIDTQAAQLRHLIASAHAEKDHIQSQIKEARRASQRAEAALRAEIESVKKAIDKAGAMDLRAKQKALALQEQVKQGWAGAEAAEKETAVVEAGMDELETRLDALRVDAESVRGEWKSTREKEEEVRDREKKARAEEEKRLAEVVGRVDKLRAKKEKKEAERVELERRLEELARQTDEAERRNEEDRQARRSSGYYPIRWDEYGEHNRSLSAHPSLNNLSTQNSFSAGAGYRPRGGAQGYQPRYASAGTVRPSVLQPSPTHSNAFYPVAPPAATSPAFRPPKATSSSSPAIVARAPSSSGVNVAAVPFHPSSSYGPIPISNIAAGSYEHTAPFMPPHLQHRIYLPNVRPRPVPNFHPPPSVLADQANRTSPPAFPPLPGHATSSVPTTGKSIAPPGPSLASIVTRAVLSPTSALAAQQATGPSPSTRLSPSAGFSPYLGAVQSPSPVSPITPSPPGVASPTNMGFQGTSSAPRASQAMAFAPVSRGERGERGDVPDFPPLSPTGPWALSNTVAGSGVDTASVRREGTPPIGTWSGSGP